MNNYFTQLIANTAPLSVSSEQITSYRKQIIDEMRKLGATDNDFDLVCDNTVINSIVNNRKAEDVAWAILQ